MKRLLFSFIAVLCCMTSFAQWTTDPSVNTRASMVGQIYYGREVKTSKDGVTYILNIVKEDTNENGDDTSSYRLQILDKDGNMTFPEKGLVISKEKNWTSTSVGTKLFIDKDGNAIIIVCDCRNSTSYYRSCTVYKVAVDGTILWEKDLADSQLFADCVGMSIAQIDDGGYVFAFNSLDDDYVPTIRVEKLTNDGEVAWENPFILELSSALYAFPFIVDAGNNKIILTYVATSLSSSTDGWARLIDATDGSVSDEEIQIMADVSFANISPYSYIHVIPGPDNGALIGWQNYNSTDGAWESYVNYIKADGSWGFESTPYGLKLSYDDYNRMSPALYYDENNRSIYAVYRETDIIYQSYCGIFMQKISTNGELLWGAEGKANYEIQNNLTVSSPTIQGAGGSDFAIFYQTSGNNGEVSDVQCYAQKYDKDGNALWDEPVDFSTFVCYKTSLESSSLINNSYWILDWGDSRDTGDYTYLTLYVQTVNIDGVIGEITSDIDKIWIESQNCLKIYNTSGQLVKEVNDGNADINSIGLRPGLYIMKGNKSQNRKFIVK